MIGCLKFHLLKRVILFIIVDVHLFKFHFFIPEEPSKIISILPLLSRVLMHSRTKENPASSRYDSSAELGLPGELEYLEWSRCPSNASNQSNLNKIKKNKKKTFYILLPSRAQEINMSPLFSISFSRGGGIMCLLDTLR